MIVEQDRSRIAIPPVETCSDPDCPLRLDGCAFCWVEPVLHCHRPVAAGSFGDLYRLDCVDCPVLLKIRHRSRGRRRSDAIARSVTDRLGHEVEAGARALHDTHHLLRSALGELSLLQKVTTALACSRDRREVARLFLAGVTAGEGFGLDRAFLFLRDGDRLVGYDAVGPMSMEEARRNREEIADHGVELENFLPPADDDGLAAAITFASIPIDRDTHPIAATYAEGGARTIRVGRDGVIDEIPDASEISLAVPLAGCDGTFGVLVADNRYSALRLGEHALGHVASLTALATMALERVGFLDRIGRLSSGTDGSD